jgi:hypothetical protein
VRNFVWNVRNYFTAYQQHSLRQGHHTCVPLHTRVVICKQLHINMCIEEYRREHTFTSVSILAHVGDRRCVCSMLIFLLSSCHLTIHAFSFAIPRCSSVICYWIVTVTAVMVFNFGKLNLNSGVHIFRKSRNHLKIPCARKVTIVFHTEDSQLLGTTVQKLSLHGDLVTGICAPLY